MTLQWWGFSKVSLLLLVSVSRQFQQRNLFAAKKLSLWLIVTVTSVSETGVTVSDADCNTLLTCQES